MAVYLCRLSRVQDAEPGHRRLSYPAGTNPVALHLFAAFVLYTMMSAALFPLIFRGVRIGLGNAGGLLTWGFSNFAQTFHLMMASLVYLLTVASPAEELHTALNWYVRGCVLAALLAIYRLANGITHIPYPNAVLYSNPSYMIYPAYKINGIWRLNGTFCEASDMAGSLLPSLALLGWELVTRPVRFWRLMSSLLLFVALLMTISSVGYLCLIGLACSGFFLVMVRTLRRGFPSRARVLAAVVLLGAASLTVVLAPATTETASKVIDSTLTEKSSSDSYRIRVISQQTALRVMQATAYIGAGWGSVRASGLGYVLLGTVGAPGMLLFLAFLGSLLLVFGVPAPLGPLGLPYGLLQRVLVAVGFLLLSMFVAGSEPVMPVLWIMFGIAIVARPMRRMSRMQPNLASARSIVSARAH